MNPEKKEGEAKTNIVVYLFLYVVFRYSDKKN